MQHSLQRKTPTTVRPRLSGLVGNGQTNNVPDILWTKDALQTLGRYIDPSGRHGFIDKELDQAIQGYQRDSGLKSDGSDGILKPGGETERTMHVELIRLSRK